MSGIEVAGLVLGAFPIVVSGLQHFTEGVETIKSWKRYQRQLKIYSRTLEAQHALLLNTIGLLFQDIAQSNDEFDLLLKDPGGSFSRRPHYEEALRNRLDHSYDKFRMILEAMLEDLQLARKALGIGEDGRVRYASRKRLPALVYAS